MAREFAYKNVTPLSKATEDQLDARETKEALVRAIQSIPDDELKGASVLFSSFRGGHVSLIV